MDPRTIKMFGKMNNDIHACRDSIDSLASNCQTNFQKLGATTNGIISNVSDNIERRVEALEHITSTMFKTC